MFPVQRALLIINRTAGTGQGEVIAGKLASIFKEDLSVLKQLQVELVSDHASARACAFEFLRESEAPAVIIAGGGGGTLRAVIEGICSAHGSRPLPGPERVRVGALRLGSGNIVARQFGVPRDPVAGLRGLLANLKTARTVGCCVMRCEVWNSAGNSEFHYGVTLAGLGQFGRIPSDLARWHSASPEFHKGAARLFGVERLTNLEYAVALLIRSVSCMLFPNSAETVDIHFQNQNERLRLFSGLVMNFPISALPFKPNVRVEDEAVVVYMIPLRGRLSALLQLLNPDPRCFRLERSQPLNIQLVDRDCIEFFLDEDSLSTYGRLSIDVAGSIAFVPGPDYQPTAGQGGSE
jgi:diacylglycerol kinase family enzyme